MTKETQLLIKLKSVSKQLGSSEGTREEIRQGIEQFLTWFKSDQNSLNTPQGVEAQKGQP